MVALGVVWLVVGAVGLRLADAEELRAVARFGRLALLTVAGLGMLALCSMVTALGLLVGLREMLQRAGVSLARAQYTAAWVAIGLVGLAGHWLGWRLGRAWEEGER